MISSDEKNETTTVKQVGIELKPETEQNGTNETESNQMSDVKIILPEGMIVRTSSKSTGRDVGSEYTMHRGGIGMMYPPHAGYPGSSPDDLVEQIRLLQSQVKFWRQNYRRCEKYRGKIRSALSTEIKRAKNAGFSVRQLSLTATPVLFGTVWLRRFL
ncbi:unnamed protein product [Echinostoma caproni]|uniref:Homeobox domain-containing protein n=1 Tax=Echinostoma caproni TaxID=27848 RepID=A0A183A4M5_9TREM|nr:unnamed protein product [Echinostoma caproni]